jgi:hypothetical protein
MQSIASQPVILRGSSRIGLIEYILQHHIPPTTLVICGTREDFLTSFIAELDDIGERDEVDGSTKKDNTEAHDESRDEVRVEVIYDVLDQLTFSLKSFPLSRMHLTMLRPDTTSTYTNRFTRCGIQDCIHPIRTLVASTTGLFCNTCSQPTCTRIVVHKHRRRS